jgi:hypothetical protein
MLSSVCPLSSSINVSSLSAWRLTGSETFIRNAHRMSQSRSAFCLCSASSAERLAAASSDGIGVS